MQSVINKDQSIGIVMALESEGDQNAIINILTREYTIRTTGIDAL